MSEFELKFQVPPERLAGLERALRRGATRRQRLAATGARSTLHARLIGLPTLVHCPEAGNRSSRECL